MAEHFTSQLRRHWSSAFITRADGTVEDLGIIADTGDLVPDEVPSDLVSYPGVMTNVTQALNRIIGESNG